jgi:hypothetical protein
MIGLRKIERQGVLKCGEEISSIQINHLSKFKTKFTAISSALIHHAARLAFYFVGTPSVIAIGK